MHLTVHMDKTKQNLKRISGEASLTEKVGKM